MNAKVHGTDGFVGACSPYEDNAEIQIWVQPSHWTPIEIIAGCTELNLTAREAEELIPLLSAAIERVK